MVLVKKKPGRYETEIMSVTGNPIKIVFKNPRRLPRSLWDLILGVDWNAPKSKHPRKGLKRKPVRRQGNASEGVFLGALWVMFGSSVAMVFLTLVMVFA